VTKQESDSLLKWFLQLLQENHDLQVRFRWDNKNDLGESISVSVIETIALIFGDSHLG
jgi:hypothetical protein